MCQRMSFRCCSVESRTAFSASNPPEGKTFSGWPAANHWISSVPMKKLGRLYSMNRTIPMVRSEKLPCLAAVKTPRGTASR